MKTLKTIAVTLLLAMFCTATQGITPNEVNVTDARKDLHASLCKKFSLQELAWDEQKNTEVVAEIYINFEGKPEIQAINGEKVYKTYVEEKLKTMKIDKENLKGKTFICRFKFRTH
jgi:hypothetical protein